MSELEALREETELLPCPFCGERQFLRYSRNVGGYTHDIGEDKQTSVGGLYQIICRECGARGPETSHEDFAVSAVRWNDREATNIALQLAACVARDENRK